MLVAGIVLATTSAPITMAQEAQVNTTTSSTLPITRVTEGTNGTNNFKSFEVKAAEAGSYYTEFWLLPSMYADKSYTSFTVYVNGNPVGTINPTVGNWQAARIDGHETLNLTEGTNVISVGTLAPEFPEVEKIRVASTDADARISSKAYEEYLANAAAGVRYDIPEDEGLAAYSSNAATMKPFSNVPLNYTFYKLISCKKEHQYIMSSTSDAPHKIDIVYYGSEINYQSQPTLENSPILKSPGDEPDLSDIYPKIYYPYTPSTSEEMQELSWVYSSKIVANTKKQGVTTMFTVPKDGRYLIRVRHATNGGSAIANLTISDFTTGSQFGYPDIPISLSYKECVIPADGNYYATFTCCNSEETDDPYLFIHGGLKDKVVGFNDDIPGEILKDYDISALDSYICQNYSVQTSGISVCNYSSSNPSSRCTIMARNPQAATQSAAKKRAKDTGTADVSSLTIDGKSVKVVAPANIGGSFYIDASEKIQNVSVYGMAGNCIGSIYCEESELNIPASYLNITQPGVYIINVKTSTGMTAKKIAIK